MKPKWIFSHYQQKPLAKIWICFSCGLKPCESIMPCSQKPEHCVDRLRGQRIDLIRQQLKGGCNEKEEKK